MTKSELRKQIWDIITKSLTDDGYVDELLSLFSSEIEEEKRKSYLNGYNAGWRRGAKKLKFPNFFRKKTT
jgi:hypothetical protein